MVIIINLYLMDKSTAKTFLTTKGTKEHEVFFKQLSAEIQDFELIFSEIFCVLRVLCVQDLFAVESRLQFLKNSFSPNLDRISSLPIIPPDMFTFPGKRNFLSEPVGLVFLFAL